MPKKKKTSSTKSTKSTKKPSTKKSKKDAPRKLNIPTKGETKKRKTPTKKDVAQTPDLKESNVVATIVTIMILVTVGYILLTSNSASVDVNNESKTTETKKFTPEVHDELMPDECAQLCIRNNLKSLGCIDETDEIGWMKAGTCANSKPCYCKRP